MKPICRDVQNRLATEGAAALRDDAGAQRHLEECADCFETLERLARLDEALGGLPVVDAPEAVVEAVLARIQTPAEPELFQAKRTPRAPVLWALAAAASIVFAVATLTPSLLRARMPAQMAVRAPAPEAAGQPPGFTLDGSDVAPPATVVPQAEKEKRGDVSVNGRLSQEVVDRLRGLGYVADEKQREQGPRDRAAKPAGPEPGKKEIRSETTKSTDGIEEGVPGGVAGGVLGGVVGEGDRSFSFTDGAVRFGGLFKTPQQVVRVEPIYPAAARAAGVEGVVVVEVTLAPNGTVARARVVRGHALLDAAALAAVRQWVFAPTLVNGQPVPVVLNVAVNFKHTAGKTDTPTSPGERPSPEARDFVNERNATEGVPFQQATGYWANTYLPGDPALRVLGARLAAWDRTALQASTGAPLRLHDAAMPQPQPFDAPRNAALGVFLHADRAGVDGPARMLVQVGLRAADRAGAQRPSMNVALVLDLRGPTATETAAGMRALALALAHAKQVGDRLSLVVAGPAGGVVVGPEEFKHGPLSVTLDRLLTAVPGDTVPSLGIADAVAAAYREACRTSGAEATLGSSAVFLASGQSFGEDAEALVDMAHQGAAAGVPLTVIGVGDSAPLPELDRLAFAGQGGRRLLDTRADAERLIEDELAGASTAVARAVRLRIRLAKGVELVDVLGSQRLDAAQAQRVREAERSIDLQLAQHLGLESDRGDDEDGIQIVIPAFRAGDAHTILLDVVAAGPGPIADVSVRYKDLVLLRNGVARASLSVAARSGAPGPLERNVVRNALALRLSQALGSAAEAVRQGDARSAARQLEHTRALFAGIGALVPALAADTSLARDAAMLREYARLVGSRALEAERARIADSLRYAGRMVLHARPPGAV